MITIIHGDNILESRKFLKQLIESAQNQEVVSLDGTSCDLTALIQATQSDQLFSQMHAKLVVAENFLTKGIKEEVIEYLKTMPNDAHLVFWEGRQIDRATKSVKGKSLALRQKKTEKVLKGMTLLKALQNLPAKPIIRIFRSTLMFDFFDSLRPGNGANALVLSQRLQNERTEVEDLFPVLADHFRYLIKAKVGGSQALSDMHPFRAQKITNQARSFTEEQLMTIFHLLLDFEIACKFARIEGEQREELYRDYSGNKLPLINSELSPEFNFELLITKICERG